MTSSGTAIKNRTPRNSIFLQLIGIWSHLTRHRRIQFCILLLLMFMCGGAELVSLGAVFPFLAVLSDPEQFWHQNIVKVLVAHLGLTDSNQLLLLVALTFAATAILASLTRLSNLWLNGRLAAAIGADLSCEVFRRTLYQPYSVHLQRNTADVIAVNTKKIGSTIAALNGCLQLFTGIIVALGLLIGMLFLDLTVAMTAISLFGTAYGFVALRSQIELRENGHLIAYTSTQQVKFIQEGLSSIRDIILDNSQVVFSRSYGEIDRSQRQLEAKNIFLSSYPRYALEGFVMLVIAFTGCFTIFYRGSTVSVIPLLGTMALGAQRLLPALQQIYSGWATLSAYSSSMSDVLALLNQSLPLQLNSETPLIMHKGIRLEDIYFDYGSDKPKVLNGFDLDIRRGERIGVIGSTGSGKSTAVDLLMGLLEPKAGKVLVDDQDLHDPRYPERLIKWRAAISHVPQNVYLLDKSVAENIAFGVPVNEIDMARVKQAAQQAQINKFIEDGLNGYDSIIGERGIRLSGGQRQRLGIARALYKKASFLVLDEATSALDTATEDAVMAAIDSIDQDVTVIMIAHRLSTLQNCDRVIKIEEGIVFAEGSPQEILQA